MENINIQWNLTGKIKQVNTPGFMLQFSYSPLGQRQSKEVIGDSTVKEWYLHDATGNVMCVYRKLPSVLHIIYATEQPIYGSNRLGVYQRNEIVYERDMKTTGTDTISFSGKRGDNRYELTDHLGNIMSVVSDRKIGIGSTGTISYYSPEVLSYTDYYPFGYPITNRSANLADYRFGFNGQEKDNEVYGEGKSLSFEFRNYDARLGKWWGIDLFANKYPNLSSYVFCANNPIKLVDPDGRKVIPYNENSKSFLISYLEKQFETDKLFRFDKNNELKINRREYRTFQKTATMSQKIVLDGIRKAITRKETVIVYINANSETFPVRESQYENLQDGSIQNMIFPFTFIANGSGYTLPPRYGKNENYYIFMNDQVSENETVSGSRTIGKDDVLDYRTGRDASSVFIHELLDEFLNYFTTKRINDSSPQRDKVYYRNKALDNIQKLPSDGKDHQ